MIRRTVVAGALVALVVGATFVAPRNVGDAAADDGWTEEQNPPNLRSASFTLDCAAGGRPISPLIYGISGVDSPWDTGTTARRWGGNPTSRYNWELHTANSAKDWFFRNTGDTKATHDVFLEENRQRGVTSALTVSMLGWVAKDNSSYSFSVAKFGPQQASAPENPDMGNGIGVNGKPLTPGAPSLTSVRSTPETIGRWVRDIRQKDAVRGRTVESYILDNEPSLWNSTHRDVHPRATTYDELFEKTVAYATVIRREDPEGKIAGPAEWGWQAYHYSAADVEAGVFLRPDRRAHGDEPLIPWYLRKIREHERATGIKLLDTLDVHFYPMGDNIGITTGGLTDPATSALRLRSTRSLWDPTYKDESWVADRMRVLPLLREWVDTYNPGLGISIGEWNFGGENHMSGGLAVAEVLGRFGNEVLTSAYYWGGPPAKSPAFWAFRAYRNFDALGGRFLDWTVPVKGSATLTSLFASRDAERKKVVALVLNLSPITPLRPDVTVTGCGAVSSVRAFSYSGGEAGFMPHLVAQKDNGLTLSVPPYSITAIEVATSGVSR